MVIIMYPIIISIVGQITIIINYLLFYSPMVEGLIYHASVFYSEINREMMCSHSFQGNKYRLMVTVV